MIDKSWRQLASEQTRLRLCFCGEKHHKHVYEFQVGASWVERFSVCKAGHNIFSTYCWAMKRKPYKHGRESQEAEG